ncbi:MAG: histidine--tRNA ligase [candidate division Zixibacteria bacterium]|nr:histidine--tRNA ligase [candidate division Zixibacteria bacterium]
MDKQNAKQKKIKPEVLKGFRDYPPSEEIARQNLVAVFREVFESFGFSPLQTPALEKTETLKGADYGSENLETIFSFTGPEKTDMALRFDLTTSLARYVAGNPEMALPFRRYQVGPVWRVDKPGPGRFREFTQFDIDTVGTASMLADAEIMAAICQSFERLGLPNYRIRYSNRKIINGLAEFFQTPKDKILDFLRVTDKLDKKGVEAITNELGPGYRDESGDWIPGLNLPELTVSTASAFFYSWSNWLTVAELDSFAQLDRDIERFAIEKLGYNPNSFYQARLAGEMGLDVLDKGLAELQEVRRYLMDLGVPLSKTQFDPTLVRGLGYYTGPVFETVLDDVPEVGSVFAGGRYDGLVERFLGRKIPAVGASAGIDRLLAALMSRNLITFQTTISEVLVTVMDQDKMPEYIALLNDIRSNGFKAEIFLGETKNLTKQLKYADKVGIPMAVIAGSDEFERGEVTVKNLVAGRTQALEVADREQWLQAANIQETIPRANLIAYLNDLRAQIKAGQAKAKLK